MNLPVISAKKLGWQSLNDGKNSPKPIEKQLFGTEIAEFLGELLFAAFLACLMAKNLLSKWAIQSAEKCWRGAGRWLRHYPF